MMRAQEESIPRVQEALGIVPTKVESIAKDAGLKATTYSHGDPLRMAKRLDLEKALPDAKGAKDKAERLTTERSEQDAILVMDKLGPWGLHLLSLLMCIISFVACASTSPTSCKGQLWYWNLACASLHGVALTGFLTGYISYYAQTRGCRVRSDVDEVELNSVIRWCMLLLSIPLLSWGLYCASGVTCDPGKAELLVESIIALALNFIWVISSLTNKIIRWRRRSSQSTVRQIHGSSLEA